MSDVSGYVMVSAKALCCNIMCESIPGSPPPLLSFVGARGEPGTEARCYSTCQASVYGTGVSLLTVNATTV